jgi:DNA gyrase/topoisomerase IV subunit B
MGKRRSRLLQKPIPWYARVYLGAWSVLISVQLSHIEHILKRPDSYIGSLETITRAMWTYDSDTKRMVNRDVKFVPGFFKIVDEILVNAADNKVREFMHRSRDVI